MIKPTQKEKKRSFIFYLMFILKKIYSLNPVLSIVFFISALVSSFLPQVESYAIGKLIDSAVKSLTDGLGDYKSFILILVAVSALLMANKFIFDINSYITQVFSLRNQNARDFVSFQAVLNAKPHYFEDPDFIKEKNKVDYNSWKISQIIESVTIITTSFISSAVIILIFFTHDWKIVVAAVVSLIFPALVKLKYGKQVWGIWDSMSDDKIIFHKYRNALYTDDPSKFMEMTVFGYGKYLLNTALGLNKKFVDKLETNERKRLVFTLFARLWEFVFTVLGLYYVFLLFINKSVSIGQFFFIMSLFQNLRNTVTFAFEQATTILSDGSFFETFYKFLNFSPKIDIIDGKEEVDTSKGIEIQFKNVCFTYPGTEKQVLNNVNIIISTNKDVALVGKNGAGKTTLIKLMLRIYDPTEGEILINGVNIKELSLTDYYRKIGVLSQNFITFGFKAWENIFIGDINKPYSLKKVVEAAKKSQAHEFIQEYPNKYDTYLARDLKDGVSPSGGQWQRIAIARVFYKEPKLIILDEPTSAIDALAEEEIFSNIKGFSKDKTVVIVSHRFATVKKADYIYVIDNGEIIEKGEHSQLIAKDSLYSKMYYAQSK